MPLPSAAGLLLVEFADQEGVTSQLVRYWVRPWFNLCVSTSPSVASALRITVRKESTNTTLGLCATLRQQDIRR